MGGKNLRGSGVGLISIKNRLLLHASCMKDMHRILLTAVGMVQQARGTFS
jgi:hypothetical protein